MPPLELSPCCPLSVSVVRFRLSVSVVRFHRFVVHNAVPPSEHLDAFTPDATPESLVERLAQSGLRGRGGGWFPAARKWQAVRAEAGRPVVIANGAEGEPGSHKDRFVMLQRPAAIVEGVRLAARAVQASEAILFLKASFDGPARALASRARDRRSRRPACLDPPRRRQLHHGGGDGASRVARGPQALAAPQAAAARRGRLEGRPTLVQNVETLARVPQALADPAAFRAGESTLVTFWGDVPLARRARGAARHAARGRRSSEHASGATEPIGLVFPAGPAGSPAAGPTSSTRRSSPRRCAGVARRSARAPCSWSGPRPVRSPWPRRSPASTSARAAASARPARSAPRASRASCAGWSGAASARASSPISARRGRLHVGPRLLLALPLRGDARDLDRRPARAARREPRRGRLSVPGEAPSRSLRPRLDASERALEQAVEEQLR